MDKSVGRSIRLINLQLQLIKTYIAQLSMAHDQMCFTINQLSDTQLVR